jgi:hypothetical protein
LFVYFSSDDNFISPIHKLTRNELREELKVFNQTKNSVRSTSQHVLLDHDNDNNDDGDNDDAGDIQFRTHQTIKRFNCCSSYMLLCKDSACTLS